MNAERASHLPPDIFRSAAIIVHNGLTRDRWPFRNGCKIPKWVTGLTDHLSWVLTDEQHAQVQEILESPNYYNQVKHFDPILLEETRVLGNFLEAGIGLKKGERILAMHLDQKPILITKSPVLPLDFNQGMREAAEYIKLHKKRLPKKSFVIGITNEKLAHLSEKYGFTVAKNALPEEISNHYKEILEMCSSLVLCYQSYENIMRRFLPSG